MYSTNKSSEQPAAIPQGSPAGLFVSPNFVSADALSKRRDGVKTWLHRLAAASFGIATAPQIKRHRNPAE